MGWKIEFVDSPTERTTAATDLLLATVAQFAVLYLQQIGQQYPWKANIWASAFGLLALATVLGAVAHGLKVSNEVKTRLWHGLYLVLGLVVALFTVGAILDMWGVVAAQWALPIMLVFGLSFFGVTLVWPDNFLLFIIYQGVAMLFALGGYSWLALVAGLAGGWLMVAAIFVTIIAAAIQASNKVSVTLIWKFDHNGVYHLVQVVGLLLLIVGLREGLR
jgi:hypothetical protein